MEKKIVLATNNKNKIKEFTDLFKKHQIKIINQKKFHIPLFHETGLNFIENALLKAKNSFKYSKSSTISDDSGLSVNILKGAPGIYSSRYAGKSASKKKNLKKLLSIMKNIPINKRQAQLNCVLVYIHSFKERKKPIISYGSIKGFIAYQPSGKNGFGYDSIFYIPKLQLTFAQLTRKQKNKISHRAKAVKMFINLFKNYNF